MKRYCDCGCRGEILSKNKKVRYIYGHYARVQVQKGMSKENYYGKEKAEQMKKSSREKQKDITWEERYGEEEEQKRKERYSKERKGLKQSNETKQKISKNNKGKITSEETKQKIREKRKLQVITEEQILKRTKWTKEVLLEIYINNAPCKRIDLNRKGGINFGRHAVSRYWKSLDEMAEEAGIPFKEIDKTNNGRCGSIGKNEEEVLNYHQQVSGLENEPFIPQFPVGGKFVDRYYLRINKVVEYDELHHNTLKQKIRDKIRENKIKEILNCEEFIRLPEKIWLPKIKQNQPTLEDF